ncbi:MAG: T9SS type A sorting domain-containing protein, partial [Bacteroidota bacterium]
ITNSNAGSESVTACDTFIWSANNTPYTSSGAYTATLTNAAGCDSTATLNLTITNSNAGSESLTACNSYLWPATNQSYTNSGTYTATLTNAAGCDSTATLNLTITQVDTSVTVQNDSLISNATGATYQWIDCATGLPIPNQTSPAFVPTQNGNYAVAVTQNGCTDTSACTQMLVIGVDAMVEPVSFLAYPNPTNGDISLEFAATHEARTIHVFNALGQEVVRMRAPQTQRVDLHVPGSAGTYFIRVIGENGNAATKKITKY